MIASAFLLCALALPVSSIREPMNVVDAQMIRGLLLYENHGRARDDLSKKRMLLVGTPAHWAFSLRQYGIKAWRITTQDANSDFDIIASVLNHPIRKWSMDIVMYGLSSSGNKWSGMRALSECNYALAPNGFLLFDTSRAFLFTRFLLTMNYNKMPMSWRGMAIWRKAA